MPDTTASPDATAAAAPNAYAPPPPVAAPQAQSLPNPFGIFGPPSDPNATGLLGISQGTGYGLLNSGLNTIMAANQRLPSGHLAYPNAIGAVGAGLEMTEQQARSQQKSQVDMASTQAQTLGQQLKNRLDAMQFPTEAARQAYMLKYWQELGLPGPPTQTTSTSTSTSTTPPVQQSQSYTGGGVDIAKNDTIAPIVATEARRNGVPQQLADALLMQESSYGTNKAANGNIGQITFRTAQNPGYGLAPLNGAGELTDPQSNIAFSMAYLRKAGDAAGVTDWNDPSQWGKALRAYNGTGDPGYVEHVARFIPKGLSVTDPGYKPPTAVATAQPPAGPPGSPPAAPPAPGGGPRVMPSVGQGVGSPAPTTAPAPNLPPGAPAPQAPPGVSRLPPGAPPPQAPPGVARAAPPNPYQVAGPGASPPQAPPGSLPPGAPPPQGQVSSDVGAIQRGMQRAQMMGQAQGGSGDQGVQTAQAYGDISLPQIRNPNAPTQLAPPSTQIRPQVQPAPAPAPAAPPGSPPPGSPPAAQSGGQLTAADQARLMFQQRDLYNNQAAQLEQQQVAWKNQAEFLKTQNAPMDVRRYPYPAGDPALLRQQAGQFNQKGVELQGVAAAEAAKAANSNADIRPDGIGKIMNADGTFTLIRGPHYTEQTLGEDTQIAGTMYPAGTKIGGYTYPPDVGSPPGTQGDFVPSMDKTTGKPLVIGLAPQIQSARDETNKEFVKEGTDTYIAAQNQKSLFTQLADAAQVLHDHGGFVGLGPTAPERVGFLAKINDAIRAAGGTPIEASAVGAWEEMTKATGQLGFETSSKYEGHSRQAAQTILNATAINPSSMNSEAGFHRVLAGVQEAAQSAIDLHEFEAGIYRRGGDLATAPVDFFTKYTPRMYGMRAISTVTPYEIAGKDDLQKYLPGTFVKYQGNIFQIPDRPGVPATPDYLKGAPPPQAQTQSAPVAASPPVAIPPGSGMGP